MRLTVADAALRPDPRIMVAGRPIGRPWEAPGGRAGSSRAAFRVRSAVLVSLLSAILSAACGAAPTSAPPAVASPAMVIQGASVWWSAPASWHVTGTPPVVPGGREGITFVSPEPIAAWCSSNPPTLQACWPLQRLSPNGVLVAWIPLQGLHRQPNASPWASITSNGVSIPVLRDTPGVCAAIAADETLTAMAPRMPDGAGDNEFVACVRGPDLATGEATVLAIMRTVRPAAVP